MRISIHLAHFHIPSVFPDLTLFVCLQKRYPANPNIEILNEKKQCRFGCYVQTEQKVVQYWGNYLYIVSLWKQCYFIDYYVLQDSCKKQISS